LSSPVLTTPTISTGAGNAAFPSATGTVMVSGNMPAFSAYLGSNQAVSSGTWTKLQMNTKDFDTASCFNTSTYRFIPNVAGYYMFTGQTDNLSGGGNRIIMALYKNGSVARYGNDLGPSSGSWSNGAGPLVSAMIQMNGTTDYVELYLYDSGGQTVGATGGLTSYFQGYLVRTA
jgi:hypothetical protein